MNDELPEDLAPSAPHWARDPWFIAATVLLVGLTAGVVGYMLIWGWP